MKKLYNLIKTVKGKDTIMMTDSLSKIQDRMETLRKSYHGKNVKIRYEEAIPETDEKLVKFKKKPTGWYNG